MLNDYVVDDLAARLAGEQGVTISDDCGFKIFVFSDRLALRVKKVDRCKKHSNVRTKQQHSIDLQQLELPGIRRPTFVTLGYHLDPLWDKAFWVHAICRQNGEIQWALPVTNDPLQAVLFTERMAGAGKQRKARVRVKGAGKAEA